MYKKYSSMVCLFGQTKGIDDYAQQTAEGGPEGTWNTDSRGFALATKSEKTETQVGTNPLMLDDDF